MRITKAAGLLTLGVASGIVLMYLIGTSANVSVPTKETHTNNNKDLNGNQAGKEPSFFVRKMVQSNWTKPAAENVESLITATWNSQEMDKSEAESLFDQYAVALADLGSCSDLIRVLESKPELSPFFSTCSRDDFPRIARAFVSIDSNSYSKVESIVKLHHQESERDKLISLLCNSYQLTLLVKLLDKGLLGFDHLFLMIQDERTDKEFANWLINVISDELIPGDNVTSQQASFATFLLLDAVKLHDALKADKILHDSFRGRLWSKFRELAMPDLWDHYSNIPGIWEVLSNEASGVELIKKYGEIPYSLLYGPFALPSDTLKGMARNAMLKDDYPLLLCMIRFGTEARFHRVLDLPIKEKTKQNILILLLQAEDKLAGEEILYKFGDITNADAIDLEFKGREPSFLFTLIPYSCVYTVVEKLATGRSVTFEDGLDVAITAVTSVKLPGSGASSVVAATTASVAEKQIAQQLTKSAVYNALSKETAQQAARQVTKNIPKGSRYALNAALSNISTNVKATSQKAINLTQFYANLGRRSATNTNTLHKLAAESGTNWVLREGGRLFVSVGEDQLANIPKNLAGALGKRAVLSLVENELEPRKLDQAWRRNVFAWWSVQAIRK